jgi:hypothetical protein
MPAALATTLPWTASAVGRALTPTILHGITLADYRADRLGDDGPPSLSSSMAKTLCSATPCDAALGHPRLKALAPMLPADAIVVRDDEGDVIEEGEKSTSAQTRGTRIHRLVLGKGQDFAVWDAKTWAKKDAKAFKAIAEAQGKLPVLKHVFEREVYAAKMIHYRLKERYGIVLDGESEVAIFWHEQANDGTLVRCRGMIDHICQDGMICDLKTIDTASPEKCELQATAYDFSIQWAAYTSGVAKIRGDENDTPFGFAFAESDGAFAVQMARLNGEERDFGQRRWRYAINKFAGCLNAGKWPAEYELGARDGGDGWAVLSPKSWKVGEWESRMVT